MSAAESGDAGSADDAADARHWDQVEEATERLLEGDRHEALELLRDVLTANPSNPYAYCYSGAALFDLEKYEPARTAYAAALKLAPHYVAARLGLIHTLHKLRDLKAAENEVRTALSEHADDSDLLYVAGVVLAATGQRKEAAKLLHRFMKSGPELELQLEVRSMLQLLAEGNEGDPFELA